MIKFSFLKGRIGLAAGLCFYVAALLLIVDATIADLFAYQGYVAREWSVWEILVGFGATVGMSLCLHWSVRRPSQAAYVFLVATVGLPVLWIPVFYGPLPSPRVEILQVATLLTFLLMRWVLGGKPVALRPVHLPQHVFWPVLTGFVVLSFVVLFSVGLRPQVLTLSEVYDQRDVYRASGNAVTSYLVGWLAATLPFVMVLGVSRRWPWVAIAGACGLLLLFGITGFKSYVVALVISLGVYWLNRQGHSKAVTWFLTLTAGIIAVALIDRALSGFTLTSLLVRRALSTAGINTGYYIDLFGDVPPYGLRHSVLSFLGDSPHALAPSRLVGTYYYGSGETAANANFMADGYANFHWVGFVLSGVLVALLLRLYDKVAAGLPLPVTASALVSVLLALANTAALTVILTHGAAVLLLCVALAPRRAGQEGFESPTAPTQRYPIQV